MNLKKILTERIVLGLWLIVFAYSVYVFFIGRILEILLNLEHFNSLSLIRANSWILFKGMLMVFILLGIVKSVLERKFRINPFWLLCIQLFSFELIFKYLFLPIFIKDSLALWSLEGLYLQKTFMVFQSAILCLTALYFMQSRVSTRGKALKTSSKMHRFLDLVFDSLVIGLFVMMFIARFSWEGIEYRYSSIEWLNDSPYPFIIIFRFFYYFTLESIFLSTPGKLHNGGRVYFQGHRITAIIIRTLCRNIPFNPLSFLGKKGWHDRISNTAVLVGEGHAGIETILKAKPNEEEA
ncbi:MAG: hypothetical protein EP332_08515 [Bacteroidetes bacterium]|nr:MAG: hypothetical protein EP332_08515 [Bacteroidota bacterium]